MEIITRDLRAHVGVGNVVGIVIAQLSQGQAEEGLRVEDLAQVGEHPVDLVDGAGITIKCLIHLW